MMRMLDRWSIVLGAALTVAPGIYAATPAGGTEAGGAAAAAAATTPKPPAAGSTQADDNLFYALGMLLSRNPHLASLDLSDQELKQVLAGIRDGYQHHGHLDNPETYVSKIEELESSRAQVASDRHKQAGASYLAKVAAMPGAHKTTSGLVYLSSVQGTGAQPGPMDRVKVQYTGKLIDGTVFDSSYKRGQPATFPLGGIIPCWKEALQLMKVGGKARVVCPSELAYGDRGMPPVIPPGSTLDFQVELLDVMPNTAPARAPGVAMPSTPPVHSAVPGAGASGSSTPPR